MLAALAGGSRRVHRVELSDRAVWIKRYEKTGWYPAARALSLLSRITGAAVLRPSPRLEAEGMVDRECRQIAVVGAAGFLTPAVLYRSGTALVLSDLGPSVATCLKNLRASDPEAHDALLVLCGLELGRLHAAGLCHGRPHPRDMTFDGERIGFLDFEEEPAAAMPLATAQARDLWLLFLQVSTRCLKTETLASTLAAWRANRPDAVETALRGIVPIFSSVLPLVRALTCLRSSEDLHRFIAATDFLRAATALQA